MRLVLWLTKTVYRVGHMRGTGMIYGDCFFPSRPGNLPAFTLHRPILRSHIYQPAKRIAPISHCHDTIGLHAPRQSHLTPPPPSPTCFVTSQSMPRTFIPIDEMDTTLQQVAKIRKHSRCWIFFLGPKNLIIGL